MTIAIVGEAWGEIPLSQGLFALVDLEDFERPRRINALNSERSRNAKIIEKHGNRFRVRPFINGVRQNLGSFATEEEALLAAEAYRQCQLR